MPDAIILGSGGHARVVLDALRACGKITPIGFLDDFKEAGLEVDGLPVLGRISDVDVICAKWRVGLAVAAIGANHDRRAVVEKAEALNPSLKWLRTIHPSAIIAENAQVSPSAMVLAGCVVATGTFIGAHCIVNNRSSIDHDNVMEDFASTGPGVVTGGNVRIGEGSHIGLGAMLKHGISIGAQTVIGAGSTVLKDMPAGHVCYGAPARQIRSRDPSSRYLD